MGLVDADQRRQGREITSDQKGVDIRGFIGTLRVLPRRTGHCQVEMQRAQRTGRKAAVVSPDCSVPVSGSSKATERIVPHAPDVPRARPSTFPARRRGR